MNKINNNLPPIYPGNNVNQNTSTYTDINGQEEIYPIGNDYTKNIPINNELIRSICQKPLGYTLFIDRHRSTDKANPQNPYGATYFDGTADDCRGSYIRQSFLALDYAISINISMISENTNQIFNILHDIIKIELDTNDDIINNRLFGVSNPEAYVYLYYGKSSHKELHNEEDNQKILNKEYRYYDPKKILNPGCKFSNLHNNEWWNNQKGILTILANYGKFDYDEYNKYNDYDILTEAQKIDLEESGYVTVRYSQTITLIKKHLRQYLADYQSMLARSTNIRQIIAAIAIFVARVEGSHFFQNGNNRLMVILLTLILNQNNLSPTVLKVPNGFSHYVLSELPKELSIDENCNFNNIDMARIEECLIRVIDAIEEGQYFYQQLMLPKNNKIHKNKLCNIM